MLTEERKTAERTEQDAEEIRLNEEIVRTLRKLNAMSRRGPRPEQEPLPQEDPDTSPVEEESGTEAKNGQAILPEKEKKTGLYEENGKWFVEFKNV